MWLLALAAGCMMAGNVLGGWLSDRVGRGSVFVLGTIGAILGILCFTLMRGPQDRVLLLLYALSGFGFGMRIAQLSTIPADAFAGPHLGAILGVVQAGGGLGGAIGPCLAGWLFDVTGSYRLAFLAALLRSRAQPLPRSSRHGPRPARRRLAAAHRASAEKVGSASAPIEAEPRGVRGGVVRNGSPCRRSRTAPSCARPRPAPRR